MWRKGNPLTLLVGVQTSTATMENSVETLVAQRLKRLPAMQETWVRSLGWEDPLEKGKATHSSLVGEPWTRRQNLRLISGPETH